MKKLIYLFVLAIVAGSLPVVAQNRDTRKVESFTKISFRVPGKLFLKQGSPQEVILEGDKEILNEIETEVDGDRLIIGKPDKWFDWSNWDDNDKIMVYVTVPNIEALSVSGSGDLIGQGTVKASNLDLNVSGSGSLKLDMDATGDVEANVSGSGDVDLKGKCKAFSSSVSGSGRVVMNVAVANNAEFSVSGSGKIQAAGSASNVNAQVSGSGKVLAADMEANRCEVRISGSGDVEINVKNELDANISGSGSVSYKGNPSKVNSHSSGSGKVRKF